MTVAIRCMDELLEHVGHAIECVSYGMPPMNVAIECVDCHVVLVEFDHLRREFTSATETTVT
jgi:hypothetical protein